MSVNDTGKSNNLAWNKQVYQRLKLALSLGLRRQIFIAVCDDLNLRNQVATRLHNSLAYPVGQVLYQPSDGFEASTPAYPRLVTLRLNLNDPNPIAQINQWLTNYPPPMIPQGNDAPPRPLPVPSFQIVGVEQLTRQSVSVQRLFLHYLRLSEQHFSEPEASKYMDSSLVLWVPRPWLHAIQQSAPQFWRSRTGVFVFAGEPTPTTQPKSSPESLDSTRGLDLGSLEQSILEQAVTPRELAEVETAADLNLVEDFDFSVETPIETRQNNFAQNHLRQNGIGQHTLGQNNFGLNNSKERSQQFPTAKSDFTINQEIPPDAVTRSSVDDIELLLSSPHISRELTELVLETINNTISQDSEVSEIAQEMLLEIEELHADKAPAEFLGQAYQKLGNFYRLRIEQGESTLENIMVAILAYQEAITHDETSPNVPDILNDLGTLYWMLYRTPPNTDEGQSYIEQAIEFYKLALKLIEPETHADTYARVQNNLGTAYGDLARFINPAENWEQAVFAYNEALLFRTAQIEPMKYAACQNNLGTAYWHLAQYQQPMAHLQKSIAAYQEALIYYTQDVEPLKYGMIQNNIGTTYWNLAQYENGAENLLLAVDAYNEALKYRTAALLPTGCAATQNNLGTAYWHLANSPQTTKKQRQIYLEKCITAYDEALALAHSLTGVNLSFDIFATHNNLGLAHYQLATDQYFNIDKKQRSQHLEIALENHLLALNALSKQPEAYQNTFNYLLKTIRAFHSELGIQGQNLALSKVPAHLLPDILPKL